MRCATVMRWALLPLLLLAAMPSLAVAQVWSGEIFERESLPADGVGGVGGASVEIVRARFHFASLDSLGTGGASVGAANTDSSRYVLVLEDKINLKKERHFAAEYFGRMVDGKFAVDRKEYRTQELAKVQELMGAELSGGTQDSVLHLGSRELRMGVADSLFRAQWASSRGEEYKVSQPVTGAERAVRMWLIIIGLALLVSIVGSTLSK